MDSFSSQVPPGFRFYPTDEELVDYYLRKRVASKRIDLDVIRDVDLYNLEPWDLEELCKIGSEEQKEWYFFSHKDKKYPTGTRTNRATKAGFWKATGRDKSIYCRQSLVGMRKTLVFYKGRAPNGQKSDWIMHEYRLETNENIGTSNHQAEEGWVVCKVFKKRMPVILQRAGDYDSPCTNWFDDQASFMPENIVESPKQQISLPNYNTVPYDQNNLHYPLKQELDHYQLQYKIPQNYQGSNYNLQLPHLEIPSYKLVPQSKSSNLNIPNYDSIAPQCDQQSQHMNMNMIMSSSSISSEVLEQVTADWRMLDKFVASQLMSQEYHHKDNNASDQYGIMDISIDSTESSKRPDIGSYEHASSTSSSLHLWN